MAPSLSHPKRRLILTALLLGALLLVFTQTARADVGPKPSMDFIFESESGEPFTIASGEQLECSTPDCSDAEPLMEAGPQRFSCTDTTCSSLAYGYDDYHKLRITFADGRVLESNVFGKISFSANYTVTIRANDLLVEEQPDYTLTIVCIVGLLCVVTFGVLVVVLVVLVLKRRGARPK